MFIARRILPCNAVTANDYRKLTVDRVPAVRNVWFDARIPPAGSDETNGLYDIWVYSPQADECSRDCELRPEYVLDRVRRVYTRYRNLCEDLHSVRMLLPLRTVVHADVSIGERARAEQVLAGILFAVGNLLAPELQRRPLNALLDAGETPDEIFNGPILLDGFIADEQLQPKVCSLAVNEIIQAIAQTQGVVGVRNAAARTGGESDGKHYRANSSISVPVERFLRLDTKPRGEGSSFTIRLFRNGTECKPDPQTVEHELNLLWTGYRRGYPLEAQYEEYFGVPSGQWRDLTRYYSIQNQYPNIYGIGAFGLPPDSTPERQAQARQLKAYLLPFEQLMADYFAQLAHAGNLFSIAPDPWPTYYSQSLVKSVPNVEPVLAPGYAEGLDEIVSRGDSIVGRRNRFLNFLLSLYANRLYADRYNGSSIPRTGDGHDAGAQERLLRARMALMQLLAPATRARGRGFDYLAQEFPRRFAGMEIKCRIEMGLDLENHQPLSEALGKSRLALARGTGDASIGRPEDRHSSYMEEHFVPVTAYPEPGDIPEISSVLKGAAATEELIDRAHDPSHLFIGKLPGEDTVVLVCRTASGGWLLIDVHTSTESAVREAYALSRRLTTVHHARTQLYIVEHTLLRFGRPRRRKRDRFVYSFTLTAVAGLPTAQRMNRDNRTMVEEIVRENVPANIVAEVCFLDPWNMIRFELLFSAWRSAVRKGHGFRVALTSARLRVFLERHRHTTSMPRV